MLERVQLFSELGEDHVRALATHAVTRTYPKHAVLVTEGDQSDALFVIVSGRVKIFTGDEQGKEVTLDIMGEGEFFGELALLDDAPRSASVVTLQPTRCLVISQKAFRRCLAEQPEVAYRLICALARRIRVLTENVKGLALLDVYGRVAQTLLHLARPVEGSGTLAIEQKLTHQDIANIVGASREMVSRILKDLADGGYIAVRNRTITIHEKLPARW